MRASVRSLLLLLLVLSIIVDAAQLRSQKQRLPKTKKKPALFSNFLQSRFPFLRGAKPSRQVQLVNPKKVVKTRQVSMPPPPPSPPSKTPLLFRFLKMAAGKKKPSKATKKAPKAVQRPRQVPQLTPHVTHSSAKVPSFPAFQIQHEAFEDLRFDRQVGNFKPSPKDKIYLDQLIGNYYLINVNVRPN